MSEFGLKVNIGNENFIIHALNNFPKEHDIIIDGIKNPLMSCWIDALIIEVIQGKLNHHYKKSRMNMTKREKKKSP